MATQEQLARESAGRLVAVGTAGAAVLLQVAGTLLQQSAARHAPGRAPGAVLQAPLFFHRYATTLILASVLLGLGYVLVAPLLVYLYRAVKARRPEVPAVTLVTAYLGPVLLGVGGIVVYVVLAVGSARYLAHTPGDYFAARRVAASGAVVVAGGVQQAGALALGFAFVLISLNAMRVGLLTRFMGILGIFVGVLSVLPLIPLPVLEWFWLGATAYLISGRWPNGVPPAWRTGRAEPWPTADEVRERRGRSDEATSPAAPAKLAPAPAPSPGQRRRSRKRRGRR